MSDTRGFLGAPHAAIVQLAGSAIPVGRIVDLWGGDPLVTLERVARLLSAGFLEFGGIALDRGARSGDGRQEAWHPKSGVRRFQPR